MGDNFSFNPIFSVKWNENFFFNLETLYLGNWNCPLEAWGMILFVGSPSLYLMGPLYRHHYSQMLWELIYSSLCCILSRESPLDIMGAPDVVCSTVPMLFYIQGNFSVLRGPPLLSGQSEFRCCHLLTNERKSLVFFSENHLPPRILFCFKWDNTISCFQTRK